MSDAAIATIVSGALTFTSMVVGFLTLWVKLRYSDQNTNKKAEETVTKVKSVEDKIDVNTQITKDGTQEATASAKEAAGVANEAKEAAQAMASKLNGGLDVAIEAAIKPLRDALQDHVLAFQDHLANDEKNMKRIGASLDELNRKIG